VTYPVAIDSNHGIWNAFDNEYWPADYFIDAQGQIRYHHFGEGEYDESEKVIQELLKERGASELKTSTVRMSVGGIEAPSSGYVQSPETYAGYFRAEGFASPGGFADDALKTYSLPPSFLVNQWGLEGPWIVGGESAVLQSAPGRIAFRFHSRDLHMVLGPNGSPIRFNVRLDGQEPRENAGVDAASNGTGEIREPRLYQLIRQKGDIEDRTFEIEFLDPGLHAYSFTFG